MARAAAEVLAAADLLDIDLVALLLTQHLGRDAGPSNHRLAHPNLIAAIPQPDGTHYWWQIMLPGSVLGLIVGYATQRYGKGAQPATR